MLPDTTVNGGAFGVRSAAPIITGGGAIVTARMRVSDGHQRGSDRGRACCRGAVAAAPAKWAGNSDHLPRIRAASGMPPFATRLS